MNCSATVRKRNRYGKPEFTAVLAYYNATGRRKWKSRSAHSQQEARRLLKGLLDDYLSDESCSFEPSETTFADLVEHCRMTRYGPAEYDSEGRKIAGVRGKATIESHIKMLEGHFGTLSLRKLAVADLRIYRRKRLLSKTSRGKPTTVATVNREMSTLRAMLNEARANDWIMVNPFTKVRPGELISRADERRRETILSAIEEKNLLAACDGEYRRHLKALVIAALDTGARRGELLQLRWPDIDFEAGVIKNVTSYKDRTIQHREVPLTNRLAAALRDLQERPGSACFRRSRKTGRKPDKSLVFGITNVQRSWEAARLDANLTHVRFHDLRHTAATRLAEHMQLALVGRVLGHSDPKTTLRYVNQTRRVVKTAVRVLDGWCDKN